MVHQLVDYFHVSCVAGSHFLSFFRYHSRLIFLTHRAPVRLLILPVPDVPAMAHAVTRTPTSQTVSETTSVKPP